MTSEAININNLWFSYQGDTVLYEVNLKVKNCDFMAMIGPNGGGKTTLIKLILGLLKPDKGEIRIFGKSPSEMRKRLGYVPQYTDIHKGFPISVLEVVLMGRLNNRGRFSRFRKKDKDLARRALKRVGMEEHEKKLVNELSGGQRQRIFIARALVTDPDILIMDEPTSGIDQEWQSNIYQLMGELNKEMTIIVASHDIGILSTYVKSVACINGTVYQHDAAEVSAETLDKAYQCPVEVIAHGLPHRVLRNHKGK